MCDTEFMEKYCNGVPIYNKLKTIRNDYDLALLDGPHTTYDVLKEVMFFGERLNNNGMMILDDWPTYKSPMIVDIAKMLDIPISTVNVWLMNNCIPKPSRLVDKSKNRGLDKKFWKKTVHWCNEGGGGMECRGRA